MTKVVKPGSTIGILGGGQLGRMMALEAREMGYRTVCLDPTPDSPCGQVSDRQFTGGFDDMETARALAEASDVVTYEFENVDSRIVSELENTYYFPQGSRILHLSRHRIREKSSLRDAGIPVTPFVPVYNREDLLKGLEEVGIPCVLKTATGGYDGKGQAVIRSREEAEKAFEEMSRTHDEFVLEQWITFQCELSVIVARNPSGERDTFPVAENIHRDNILHLSIVPARVDRSVQEKARELALKIADTFDLVGLLAVEMFLTEDGNLYVNELAPRPHNSGHYTQDACLTSQFEQHVRTVCNLPLGPTDLITPVVMVNILGEHLKPVLDQMTQIDPRVKIHLYGKKEAKTKRKMGHLNVVAESTEQALDIIKKMNIWT
ncbi:MAG: 5-(carboxyamino)imidazole ribonucleotide synthase [Bacillaceae bacterium]|nr:5-(carboxyamino)imidazole ribonucleotide synthase [Bacillaceae bacterium]